MAELSNQEYIQKLDELEKDVRAFAKNTRAQLLQKLASMGLKERIELAKTQSKIRIRKNKGGLKTEQEDYLYQSVKASVKKRGGDIESIRFSFARHGAFLEHGVGKGRKRGSSAAAKAQLKSKAPWIQPVVDPNLKALAELLEEKYADIAIAEIKLSIPGVISTTQKIGG